MPPLQYTPSVGTTIALLVADCLSILSCCFVIVAFMKIKLLRRHPSSLIRDRCIADAIFSLVTAAGHLYFRLGQSSATSTSGGTSSFGAVDCKAFSFITMATTLAAEMYFAAMTVDLHLSMTNPFTNWKRNLRWYHGVTIGVSLAAATALVTTRFDGDRSYGRDNFLDVCWVRNFSDSGSLATSFWVFFLVPLIIIYTTALTLLAQASRRLRQGLPETFEARVEIFRSTLRFNLSYVAFWVVAVSVYTLISVIDYRNPSDFLSLLLALSLGSKGTVTTVIWLLTFGKDLTCTCKRGCIPRQMLNAPSKPGPAAPGGAAGSGSAGGTIDDAADLRPFLNVSLRREVLYYTTLGIAKSVARVAREGGSMTAAAVAGTGAGGAGGSGSPGCDVGLDEEYSPAHGIRANVLLLSRRKEELGLFDLEANKRRAAELVAAQRESQRYTSLPAGPGGSSSSRSRPDVPSAGAVAGATSRRSVPTSLTSVADSIAGSSVSPFGTTSGRTAPPPAIAAAAILPVGASSDSQRLGAGLALTGPPPPGRGPALPTSGMHSINRAPITVQRSSSDLTVPLLSPARESEVQELYRQGQGQGSEWGVGSAGERERARTARSTGSARLAALRGAQQRGSATSAATGAGTVSRTQRTSRTAAGAAAAAAGSGAAAAADTSASAVRDAQRMLRGRRGCCSSACSRVCEGLGSGGLARHRFVDVEPFLFRRLRLQAGISDSDYVLALSRTRREKFSEGASSQFFYYSTDERMLVKTLDADEVQVLVSMLHAYSRYMSANPHSLLPRFFGLHAITMYGHTFHFCVMANVLATGSTSVQDRYDLKGSWVNRGRRPLEKGEKADCRYCGMRFRVGEGGNRFATEGSGRYACPARVNRPHEPNVILKDNDLNAKLRLAPQTAQALGDQIAGDADFLRGHGITDYSLLLGVHRTRYKLMDAASAAGGGLPGVGLGGGVGAGAGSGAGSAAGMGILGGSGQLSTSTLHSHTGAVAGAGAGGSGIASIGGVPLSTTALTSGAGVHPNLHPYPAGGPGVVAVPSPYLTAQDAGAAGVPTSLSLTADGHGSSAGAAGAGGGAGNDTVAVLMAALPTPGSATHGEQTGFGHGSGGRAAGAGGAHLSIHRPGSSGAGSATASLRPASTPAGAASGSGSGAAATGQATPAWGIDLPLSDIMGTPGSPGSFALPRHLQARMDGAGAGAGGSHAAAGAAGAGSVASSLLAADMSGLHVPMAAVVAVSRQGSSSSRSGDDLGPVDDAPSSAAAAAAAEQRRAAGLGLADEEDMGGGVFRDEDEEGPLSGALPGVIPNGGSGGPVLPIGAASGAASGVGNSALMRMSSQSSARTDAAGARPLGGGFATIGSGASSGPDDAMHGGAGGGSGLLGDSHVVPFFKQYRGGLRATVIEAPSLYYLGIIDILGRYTWSKWLERQIKIYFLFKSGAGISAMDPENYAQRFRTRVLAQMLDGWIDQAHSSHEM